MATLIFCSKGTPRYTKIALDYGWKAGSRLPETVYYPIYFADQDWKSPDRKRYMSELAKHRPHMATVLDLDREDMLGEVLDWAGEAAQWVNEVVIVPKVSCVSRIPERVASAKVILGYSVPTKYGGTEVPIWEFEKRPVHLLGGSPNKQMKLLRYLNVVSADNNYFQRQANKYCSFWENGKFKQLKDVGLGDVKDAPYVAFELSCKNIMEAWIESTRRKDN